MMYIIFGILFLGIGVYSIIGSIVEWAHNNNQHHLRLQNKIMECYQSCDNCGSEKRLIKHTYSKGILNEQVGLNTNRTRIQTPQVITEYYFECIKCKKRFKSPIQDETNETNISTIKLHNGDISFTQLSKDDFKKKLGITLDYSDKGITGCRQPFFIFLGLISIGIGIFIMGIGK
ncbi:MAG: hypothetical protein AB9897_04525 [Anaerolineaceae bacterium]